MSYESFGRIKVRTYIASGALPIEGTLVKIYGIDDHNKDEKHSLITNSNGVTAEILLPAPMKSYSTSPGAKENPYAVYNVELAKEGYYPKRIENVPVFSDTSAILPIEMIPFAYSSDGKIVQIRNLNSVVYENGKL